MDGLLVANRGEIAVRIVRAARESGLRTVTVAPADDEASLHARRADEFHRLPGAGVAAYLDGPAILAAARATGCGLVHPGYGLLSENAGFARACVAEGVTFIGPGPDVLDLFGDKTAARAFARQNGVPVVPGTDGPTTLAQAREFAEAHGPVMVKAVAGGGGRGMRVVGAVSELDEAFERCAGEAGQAFGNGDLYVEALVPSARHIEVQIVADGTGPVHHLWERDCSIQRRQQKLVEIAPSPALDPALRDRLLMAAVRLASAARYTGVGTVEFLVSGDDFWFLEVNPRLQVEHTVTEEITGVDLVRTQLKIALGVDIGFGATPHATGFAVQARVNLETLDADGTTRPHAGTLTAFTPPSGPGVRVDTYGYTGYRTSTRYDSLLAKVIARGDDALAAVARAEAALAEFQIDGVPTNIPVLRAILRHPDVAAGRAGTSFVADHVADFAVPHPAVEPVAVDGLVFVSAPMDGTVASVDVAEGDVVGPGARLAVLEAMKMEHVVRAERGGVVRSVAVGKSDTVTEGAVLLYLVPDDATSAVSSDEDEADHDVWAPEVEEIRRRRSLGQAMGGPDKIARQHATRRSTVRERIASLADPASFREIGALTGFAEYDAAGGLTSILPANFVAGTAKIDGRQVVLGADDFTVRGGSGDAAIHAKQVYAEQYAREMRLPVVRLLDGASGGGSVKMAQEAGFTYVPINPAWDAVVDNLSLVPVVAACLGPTVGLGAARLVMSHLAVLVAGTGQLFTAGPPVVRGATGEDLTKEELGGVDVHRRNGAVERFAATEAEAFDIVRRFCPTCRAAFSSCHRWATTRIRPTGTCWAPCRGIGGCRTGSSRSWTRSSTRVRCSGTQSTAARWSPRSPGWPAIRSGCWPRIRSVARRCPSRARRR